jgi:hypothetical protein
MIIVTERKLTYKSDIKDPKEVQILFDMIDNAFSEISGAISELSAIFFNAGWNLKESQKDSLAAYTKAVGKIKLRLTQISMMNSTLTRFLSGEQRPIPIQVNTPCYIDMETEMIAKQLRFYYKEVKGTLFPKFDDEIKQHQDLIVNINHNIDMINAINSAYPRMPTIRRVRNIPSIH